MLGKVPPERIWDELKNVFSEIRPGLVLLRMCELRIWQFLFPGVDATLVRRVFREAPRSLSLLRCWDVEDEHEERWLVYIIMILHQSDWGTAQNICRRYNFNKNTYNRIASALGGWRDLLQNLVEPYGVTMSELTRQTKLIPREAYPLIIGYLPDNDAKKRFKSAIECGTYVKPVTNGKILQLFGYEPGPLYKKAMNLLWQARFNGYVHSLREEQDYLKRYI
jgi:tRNA nucleotidyltransferase (CCA-adding enzyme)